MAWEISLTPKQIAAIYRAGMKRGSEESTAYEWGSFASGEMWSELENVLVWSDDCNLTTGLDYDSKENWWADFLAEMGNI